MDTVRGVAYGILDVKQKLPQEYVVAFLSAVGRGIDPIVIPFTDTLVGIHVSATRFSQREGTPMPSGLAFDTGRPMLPVWPGYPELTSEVAFIIRRDGTVSDFTTVVNGDLTVLAALRAAVLGAPPNPFPPDVGVDGVRATLRLALTPESGSVIALPLFELLALKTAAAPPKFDRRYPPALRYPPDERTSGNQALVVVWFDVTEDGRLDKNSFGAASPQRSNDPKAYDAFVSAAINGIKPMRYQPAQQGECRIRMRAVQSVRFSLLR